MNKDPACKKNMLYIKKKSMSTSSLHVLLSYENIDLFCRFMGQIVCSFSLQYYSILLII